MFALVLVILAVGIIVPFSIGYILAISHNVPRTDFIITSKGTNQSSIPVTNQSTTPNTVIIGNAYDERNNEAVNVSISITGVADGDLENSLNIDVVGGDINIEKYGLFSISGGSGTIVKSGVTTLELDLGEQYGGQHLKWTLTCEINEIDEKTLSVVLTAENVILPVKGYPSLTNLSINCTIIFE